MGSDHLMAKHKCHKGCWKGEDEVEGALLLQIV